MYNLKHFTIIFSQSYHYSQNSQKFCASKISGYMVNVSYTFETSHQTTGGMCNEEDYVVYVTMTV